MNWLFAIWTKPFAQWNLLDLSGVVVTITLGMLLIGAARVVWGILCWEFKKNGGSGLVAPVLILLMLALCVFVAIT